MQLPRPEGHICALAVCVPNDALPEFLTPAEELSLVTHYTVELLRAAAFIELPTEIRATAAIFLRRFYVTNSIMTYPQPSCSRPASSSAAKPRAITCACLSSPTSSPIPPAKRSWPPNTSYRRAYASPSTSGTPSAPSRAPSWSCGGWATSRTTGSTAPTARPARSSSSAPLVTDAYFHYTPGQIMMAALAMADEGLVERMLREAFAAQGEAAKDKCWELIQACRVVLEKEPPEKMNDNEERKAIIKPLNRKLKKCRDPDRVDLVALQKARREQAMVKKPKIPVKADGAVFGESIGDGRESKRRKTETEE
ncbi:cyclin H [Apiospora arundinis]